MPTPSGLFANLTVATATVKALQAVVAKYGTRVTTGELLEAGILADFLGGAAVAALGDSLTVIAGLTAAFYVGACVGCLIAATAEKLTD